MSLCGGMGVVHRYNNLEDQVSIIAKTKFTNELASIGAAVGMSGDFVERSLAARAAGANVICVDVAHGHHSMMERCLKTLRDKMGDDIHIMAGNVATLEAFNALALWGADSIRVGIGGGSICSTRLVTGHGVPTFQSVMDCAKSEFDAKIIADGGLKTSGDIVKALAAGADFVMLGSMLAGTDETPGEVMTNNRGTSYKVYRGMASRSAQDSWRNKSSSPEGIATTVGYKGPVSDILSDIVGGIRSGFSYSGARNLTELHAKATFVQQTAAGQAESNTHILTRR
jgi:IMP dehydrogenase